MLSVINAKPPFWFLLVLLSFFLLISGGCAQEEIPKKVSLNKRTSESVREVIKDTEKGALGFGFDLRLGPKEDVRIYTPFLKYLEETTGRRFRIKFTERYEDTVENLGKGITSFAAVGTLSYILGKEKYGIKYLASGLNDEGKATYRAVIFTRPGGDIQDVKDLKGRSFAFGSKMSTQGHLIPRKMLEDSGILLKDLSFYVYTGSHINTVRAVLNGECDAGGVQDNLAEFLAKEGKIKILKFSRTYPSSVIAYNPSLDSKTIGAVRSALLVMDPRGKHKGILIDWDRTEMPNGFMMVRESDFEEIKILAKKYGLMQR